MKKFRLFPIHFLLFTVCFFLAPNADAKIIAEKELTTIKLPEQYVVPNERMNIIRLGDLAESIAAPNSENLQTLANLEIVNAPDPGQTSKLSNLQVLTEIRKIGYDYGSVRFQGPKVIDVYGSGQWAPVTLMVDALKAFILKETGWSEEELTFHVLSAPTKDAWLPPKKYEIAVNRINKVLHGNGRYEVCFYIDQIQIEKCAFIVRVGHRRKVYVPVHDMERGEVITMNDVREEVKDIIKEQYDRMYIGRLEDLIGQRCRTSLSPMEPVQRSALETNYVLKRGSVVQMILRHNGTLLQTTAKAQTRGAPGQIIPVKVDSTARVVKAKVINHSLVEWVSS